MPKLKTDAAPYRRMKLLERAEYAREELNPGSVVMVDADTGRRWEVAKIAIEVREPAPSWPICRRCSTQFSIPASAPPGSWVACPNCKEGWHR